MAIAESDKVRARHHMGYVGVQAVATYVLGVPAALQTQFMIERAFTAVLPQSEAKFRSLLDNMDTLEQQIMDDADTLIASKVGEISLRDDEYEKIIQRYEHMRGALGNLLGVPPNPYDMRPWLSGGAGRSPVNVPVSG